MTRRPDMLYPNPFDFDRSGDLGFSEEAFQNEFLSGEFDDVDDDAGGDYDSVDYDD